MKNILLKRCFFTVCCQTYKPLDGRICSNSNFTLQYTTKFIHFLFWKYFSIMNKNHCIVLTLVGLLAVNCCNLTFQLLQCHCVLGNFRSTLFSETRSTHTFHLYACLPVTLSLQTAWTNQLHENLSAIRNHYI